MAETRKMRIAVRKLAVARQRRVIAALRGQPVVETVAIADEQDALREISRLRREEAAEEAGVAKEAGHEGVGEDRLPFTDVLEDDDDDDELVARYAQ